MAVITSNAPIAIRRLKLPRLHMPRLAVGASLDAMLGVMGKAFTMAYVDPYTSSRHRPKVLDEDLEGRDPDW